MEWPAARTATGPRLRILHVVSGPEGDASPAQMVSALADAQARNGAAVTVFFVDPPQGTARTRVGSGVEGRVFSASRPRRDPGSLHALAQEIERRIADFDVLHVHGVWGAPSWWAMKAAAAACVPYVVAPHGSFEAPVLHEHRWGLRLWGRFTERPLLERATCLHALSATELTQMREAGLQVRKVVIPVGIDSFDRAVAPLGKQLGLPEGARTLLMLARLVPNHGAEELLAAFQRVHKLLPELHLVIAGDEAEPGYRGRLRQLAQKLEVADRVRFLGEAKGARKAELLLGADVYVVPGATEGFPVNTLEAMAAGRPVILTPAARLPVVAERDAGWTVGGAPPALASAIVDAFNHPQLARHKGDNARALVREIFTWERSAAKTLDLYRELHAVGHAEPA